MCLTGVEPESSGRGDDSRSHQRAGAVGGWCCLFPHWVWRQPQAEHHTHQGLEGAGQPGQVKLVLVLIRAYLRSACQNMLITDYSLLIMHMNSLWGFWTPQLTICDPIARNESHWYSVTVQNATIFYLQVRYIDFWFSSKSGASGTFLFENITFNGQIWCFMTVSGILDCNCCNTVACETNFLSPISQNGTLYTSQIDLSITFEPVGRFA